MTKEYIPRRNDDHGHHGISWSMMVNHGLSWWALIDHDLEHGQPWGWPWSTIATALHHGQSIFYHGWPWSNRINHGQPRTDHGWLWSTWMPSHLYNRFWAWLIIVIDEFDQLYPLKNLQHILQLCLIYTEKMRNSCST